MDRIIQSPGKYIQGADVINRLGEYLKPLAERWLVVGDKFVLGFAQSTVEKSFKDAGLVVEIAPFGGECSQNEIDRRLAVNVRKMRSTVCVASRRLRSVAQFSVSVAEKLSILPKHWHISWVFR